MVTIDIGLVDPKMITLEDLNILYSNGYKAIIHSEVIGLIRML